MDAAVFLCGAAGGSGLGHLDEAGGEGGIEVVFSKCRFVAQIQPQHQFRGCDDLTYFQATQE